MQNIALQQKQLLRFYYKMLLCKRTVETQHNRGNFHILFYIHLASKHFENIL